MKYPIKVVESRSVERITLRQVFIDFFNAFSVERGLIYTLKILFINPGKLVRRYLGDGRYQIIGAFRLLILTSAVSLSVQYFVNFAELFQGLEEGAKSSNESLEINAAMIQRIFFDWYNLFLWIAIPIYALCSYLFFVGRKFNYAEHVVLQSFYTCAVNLLYLTIIPLTLFVEIEVAFLCTFIVSLGFYLFILSTFFSSKGFFFLFKTLMSFVLGNLIYGLVMTLVLGIILKYTVG